MDVIILAAGKGNRLKPLTNKTPKSLLRVGEKTVLQRILDSLPEKKVGRVFVVVNHLAEKIDTFIKNTRPKHKFQIKTIKQSRMKGTYGALNSAKKYLTDWFVVINGDDLHRKKDIISFFQKNNVIGICKKNSKYFEVLFDNQNNFLGFKRDSKKENRYIATGCYTLNKSFFSLKPEKTIEGEYGIPQTLEKNIKKLKLRVIKEKYWEQLNTKEDLTSLRQKYS